MTFIVDTNVLVVANDRESPQAPPHCVVACANRLRDIAADGRLALDDAGTILDEYKRYSNWHGQPGVGDAFFKWVVNNLWNAERCDRIGITLDGGSFAEFPKDPRLVDFDLADRKFVAVAAAHPDRPPIVQAVDRKWTAFTPALAECGIIVHFLCS